MKRIFPLVGRIKMKVLLAVLVGFVVLDGVQTELLVSGGVAREANPLLAPLVGDLWFLLAKVFGAFICALIIWDIYKRMPRIASVATTCFIGVYGAITVWNTSLFFIA